MLDELLSDTTHTLVIGLGPLPDFLVDLAIDADAASCLFDAHAEPNLVDLKMLPAA